MRSLASAGMGGEALIGIARWRRRGEALDHEVRKSSQTHESADPGRCVVASLGRCSTQPVLCRCGRHHTRISTITKPIRRSLFIPWVRYFRWRGRGVGCYRAVAVRERTPCGFMNPHCRPRATETQRGKRSRRTKLQEITPTTIHIPDRTILLSRHHPAFPPPGTPPPAPLGPLQSPE